MGVFFCTFPLYCRDVLFFLHVSSFVLAAAGFSLFPGGGVFLIENAGEMAFDILRSGASLRRTNPDAMRTSGFVCIRILRRRRARLRHPD